MRCLYCFAASMLVMYKYFAFTGMLFSLSLFSANALATTLEDIDKFNKDQLMEYVHQLDNVETNKENCDVLHGVERKLFLKRVQYKKQLSDSEQVFIIKKVGDYRKRCVAKKFW